MIACSTGFSFFIELSKQCIDFEKIIEELNKKIEELNLEVKNLNDELVKAQTELSEEKIYKFSHKVESNGRYSIDLNIDEILIIK